MILQGFIQRFKKGVYIGDFVYGANDGIVTTFAVVAGAAGAALSPGIVVILGLANLFADGFSMGASNFLALRSEKELERRQKSERGETVSHDTVGVLAQHGFVTFLAFIFAGVVPLVPYLTVSLGAQQFLISSLLAAATFFAVGGIRTLITGGHFGKGGFEMLLVGGVAAALAFIIGWTIKTVFGVAV